MKALHPALKEDAANVVEQVTRQIQERSTYMLPAMIEFIRIPGDMNRGYLGAAEQACQTIRQQFLDLHDEYYTALTEELWGETLLNEVSN